MLKCYICNINFNKKYNLIRHNKSNKHLMTEKENNEKIESINNNNNNNNENQNHNHNINNNNNNNNNNNDDNTARNAITTKTAIHHSKKCHHANNKTPGGVCTCVHIRWHFGPVFNNFVSSDGPIE